MLSKYQKYKKENIRNVREFTKKKKFNYISSAFIMEKTILLKFRKLARYRYLKIILLDNHQNDYRKLKHNEQCYKKILIFLAISLNILYNYSDSSTKLFLSINF